MKTKVTKKILLSIVGIICVFLIGNIKSIAGVEEYACASLNETQTETVGNTITRISSSTGYVIDRKFAYYNYNHNGICGSIASANLLQYYDEYYDDNIIAPENEYNEIGILTILTGLIEGVTDFETEAKSNYIKVVNGVNKYLTNQSSSYRVKSSKSDFGIICQQIKNNNPVMLGLVKSSTYGNHWVLATGYYKEFGNLKTLYLVDGWSKSQKSTSELSAIEDMVYMG